MGSSLTTLLLDTHVIHWWSIDDERRLSRAAVRAINRADELAAADISWFELAWLARQERIVVPVPLEAWLEGLSSQIRTVAISPAIAASAASLPPSFPRDPTDRLIYATAVQPIF